MSATETYVYGVLRAGAADVTSARGVGPLASPLRKVSHGPLCAIVSDVPAGELARPATIFTDTRRSCRA